MSLIKINQMKCKFRFNRKAFQCSGGSRIFPRGGRQLPKWVCLFIIFAENCMKMKEFGPQGGRASLAPPLGSANAVGCVQSACQPYMLWWPPLAVSTGCGWVYVLPSPPRDISNLQLLLGW